MPLSAECPECGTRYNVPDKLAGKKAKCKKCGATMSIPTRAFDIGADLGFAPEEDPLAALQDLARASGEADAPPPDVGPAPARKRTAATSVPPGWTPDSVVVEKESSSPPPSAAIGSGRWSRRASAIDPVFLSRLLAFLYVAALVGAGAYIHSKISGVADTRGIMSLWGLIGSNVILFFVVAAPMTMLGAFIGAKIFGEYLVEGAYTRALGLAAAGPLIGLGIMALVLAKVFPADATVPLLIIGLVLPVTFVLVKLLFEFTWPKAIVAWVLCGILGLIGMSIATRTSTKIASAIRGTPPPADGQGKVVATGSRNPLGWFIGDGAVESSRDIAQRKEQEKTAEAQPTQQPKAAPTDAERKRAESAQRLRQIYAAITAHLAATNRNWPADLATLQRERGLDPQALVSPFGPAFASGDFVYKPYVPEAVAGPDVVIAYDNAELSNGEGASVLFGGGGVRWLDRASVEAALQQSEGVRASAVQQREQQLAMRSRQHDPQRTQQTRAVDGGGPNDTNNTGAGGDARRVRGARDVAERITAAAQGFVKDVQDLAVRRGTEQLIRPVTPALAVAVLVRGAQGDTVEVFDGKSAEPVDAAQFESDQQFRNNPGAYALSPDGKLVARLASFPKLKASVYSFEKKTEAVSVDLEPKFGEPTLVGFMSPDRFVVRWQKGFEYGLEVWDAKTGRRGRQLNLFRVDPPPSPGSEAISPDGRSYAVLNRAPPANNPRARVQTDPVLSVLVYDVIGGATQPRRLAVPVLNNQLGVQSAGLAFSPDKTRLALLLVDNQGRAVVVTWNLATGKPLPERVLAEKVDPPRVGFGRVRSLDWVGDSRALLVAGRFLMNPETGETLAVLDAGRVLGQAVTNGATVHLAHGEFNQMNGLAVVPLNEARLPEKPGAPNRAVAAPAR